MLRATKQPRIILIHALSSAGLQLRYVFLFYSLFFLYCFVCKRHDFDIKVLAKLQGLDWKRFKKPIELQKELNASFKHLIELIKTNMHSEEYSMEELVQLLETSESEIISNSLTKNTANCKVLFTLLVVFIENENFVSLSEKLSALQSNFTCVRRSTACL